MLCSLMFGCMGHISMSCAILFHTTQFHELHHLICLFRKNKKTKPTFWEPKHRLSWCCVSSKRFDMLQRPAFITCITHAHMDTATGYVYFTGINLNTLCTELKWPYNCGHYSDEELVSVASHLLPRFMVSEPCRGILGTPLGSLRWLCSDLKGTGDWVCSRWPAGLCGVPGISETQLGNCMIEPHIPIGYTDTFHPHSTVHCHSIYRRENVGTDQPLLPLSHWLIRHRMWTQTCWHQCFPIIPCCVWQQRAFSESHPRGW